MIFNNFVKILTSDAKKNMLVCVSSLYSQNDYNKYLQKISYLISKLFDRVKYFSIDIYRNL